MPLLIRHLNGRGARLLAVEFQVRRLRVTESTFVNLVFIPGLYVLMQKLRGESKRSREEEEGEEPGREAGTQFS